MDGVRRNRVDDAQCKCAWRAIEKEVNLLTLRPYPSGIKAWMASFVSTSGRTRRIERPHHADLDHRQRVHEWLAAAVVDEATRFVKRDRSGLGHPEVNGLSARALALERRRRRAAREPGAHRERRSHLRACNMDQERVAVAFRDLFAGAPRARTPSLVGPFDAGRVLRARRARGGEVNGGALLRNTVDARPR